MNRSTARLSALDHDHAATQMEPSIQPIDNYRAQPEGVDEGPGVDIGVDTEVDTGVDTGLDTGVDAGVDTGVDILW